MSNWKTYGKIKSLLLSRNKEDAKIGAELLLANSLDHTGEQFYYLNRCVNVQSLLDLTVISTEDLQKYCYDKRKEEKRANKGRNIQKDK